MAKEDWQNDKSLDLRTKLGLRVLMLMFRIISPYRFAHEFEKELTALQKQLDEV
jgi:hypothetical protein